MSTTTVPGTATDRKSDYVLVPARDMEMLHEHLEFVVETLADLSERRLAPMALAMRAGWAQGIVRDTMRANGIEPPADDFTPLAIHEPEPEAIEPGPDPAEIQWAAENLIPCKMPATPEQLACVVAGSLESLGLEPEVQGRSIFVRFGGREYRMPMEDLTAYYDALEREYQRRAGGITEDESAAVAAGLPLG